jgi:hypothetical protein
MAEAGGAWMEPHAESMTTARVQDVPLCTRASVHEFCTRTRGAMQLPTMRGDVLILQTGKDLRIHAVGRVTEKGQADFHRAKLAPVHIVNYDEAVAAAQALVTPGRRIFLVNIDSADQWSEIAT